MVVWCFCVDFPVWVASSFTGLFSCGFADLTVGFVCLIGFFVCLGVGVCFVVFPGGWLFCVVELTTFGCLVLSLFVYLCVAGYLVFVIAD